MNGYMVFLYMSYQKIVNTKVKLLRKDKTKQPPNMFMLSFRNDNDVNKIFSTSDILCKSVAN